GCNEGPRLPAHVLCRVARHAGCDDRSRSQVQL
ncbi:MAG: hypothetical protein AVDCRST_MAG65-2221, partial [uncultured Solirubrobacteraceae bacterium]